MARQLVIELVGKSDKFTKSLDTAGNASKSFGDKIGEAGKKMTAFATVPIVGALGLATKAASDLNESMSKVGVVFGDSAEDVEKWARSAAKNLGIPKQAALEAAGTFGNLFSNIGFASDASAQMSQDVIKLSADLGSFNNLGTDEVLEKLRAGLLGESEPLKSLGVNINEAAVKAKALALGLGETGRELTEGEKIQARYALIVEQTSKAQGDFARTADGMANSTKIAQASTQDAAASLGTSLQPIVAQVAGIVGVLAEKFAGLSEGQQKAIVIVGLAVAAIGPLITVIGALSTAIGFLAANPIVLIIAGIAALAAGLVIAYQKSETFRNIVDRVFDGVQASIQSMWRVIEPIFNAFRGALDRIAGPLGSVLGAAGKLGGIAGGIISKIPGFANGGVVGGAVGQAQLAVVHGGERITPYRGGMNGGGSGGTTVVVNVSGSVITERDLGRVVADAMRNNALIGVG